MGHECAHFIKKHYQENGASLKKVCKSLEQELDADSIGYDLMRETMSQLYPNVHKKSFFNFGFDIFFKNEYLNDLRRRIFINDPNKKHLNLVKPILIVSPALPNCVKKYGNMQTRMRTTMRRIPTLCFSSWISTIRCLIFSKEDFF